MKPVPLQSQLGRLPRVEDEESLLERLLMAGSMHCPVLQPPQSESSARMRVVEVFRASVRPPVTIARITRSVVATGLKFAIDFIVAVCCLMRRAPLFYDF